MSPSRFAVADYSLSSPSSSLSELKPRPAKVLPHAVLTHQSANRLISHVQVLANRLPPAVHYLEQEAARLRPASSRYLIALEDPTLMTPHTTDQDIALKDSMSRLMNFIQVFGPSRPRSVIAAERCLTEVVAEHACHQIWDGLQTLSPEDVAKVQAFVAQLQRDRHVPPE